jgi:tetratricopeptide (TPR) repeat protein
VFAIRAGATAAVWLLGVSVLAAPSREQIAGWVRDLESNDPGTWRRAVAKLWEAGKAAEPALRSVMKHRDPDVVLRARLVLGRFDWGIYPDTPVAVVQGIERYRDGDAAQRKLAATELMKQGRPGYAALQRLLARESDLALRRQVAEHIRNQCRPLARDLLAAGDTDGAARVLEAAAAGGDDAVLRDLAVLWVLTSQAAAKARALEAQTSDRNKATLCAYLHRASGDLAAARRVAAKAGLAEIVTGILDEQEDHAALARSTPKEIRDVPARLAVLLHRAGDHAGAEAALARIPAGDHATRATVLFFTGRPRAAIAAERAAGNLAAACAHLAAQGRRHDALALSISAASGAGEQRVWLLLEQAKLAHRMGEKELTERLLAEAFRGAEQVPGRGDGLLAEVARVAIRLGRRHVLEAVGQALDRTNAPPPRRLLAALSAHEGDLLMWWDFLRRRPSDSAPSAVLARLNRWFGEGKAGTNFDALLVEAERRPVPTATMKEKWRGAVARACLAVGRTKKAEELLRAASQTGASAAGHLLLGDFYFEQKRWAEAAAEYNRAARRRPAEPLGWYLLGAASARAGQAKEGRALTERARLLSLADEAARYTVANALAQRGLAEEAAGERELLVRSAPFQSIYTTNAATSLAARAVRSRLPLEAARYYRRVVMNLAQRGGAFLDATAYLRVPGLAHLHQAHGLLAAGKLDDALAEARRLRDYLPEETSIAIELVRALDRASRKSAADALFEGVFPLLQRACVAAPRSAECHNRLAWLGARCNRQLNAALRHARRAVALAPGVPGPLDTLAEVHFQRGEKAEAEAAIRQALKLAPADTYYAAQLRRITAGDRTAALPRR